MSSRPRRGTEQVFFDTFADWSADDQAAALKVLEALHRQRQRESRKPALQRMAEALPEHVDIPPARCTHDVPTDQECSQCRAGEFE